MVKHHPRDFFPNIWFNHFKRVVVLNTQISPSQKARSLDVFSEISTEKWCPDGEVADENVLGLLELDHMRSSEQRLFQPTPQRTLKHFETLDAENTKYVRMVHM